MTTAFTPFTTANAVSSIDLLRPSDASSPRGRKPSTSPSPPGPRPSRWKSPPPRTTPPRPSTSCTPEGPPSKTAAHTAYLTAFENASPETRNSLLQTLHQEHLTLTGWANRPGPTNPHRDRPHRTALRREYNSLFGFPIITSEAIRWIAQMTAGNTLLEIGAGNGYLASRAHQGRREPHTATDPHPPSAPRTDTAYPWHPYLPWTYCPSAGTDAIALHPDRDILWSWPDNSMPKYTHETLRNFEGRFLVYIGEDIYGSTGSPVFHHVLEDRLRHQLESFPTSRPSPVSTTASSSTNAPDHPLAGTPHPALPNRRLAGRTSEPAFPPDTPHTEATRRDQRPAAGQTSRPHPQLPADLPSTTSSSPPPSACSTRETSKPSKPNTNSSTTSVHRPRTLRNRPRQPGRHPLLQPRHPGPTRPLPPHIPASPHLIIIGHRDPEIGHHTRALPSETGRHHPPPSAPCKTRPFPGQISPSQGIIGPPSSGPSQGA